MDTDGLRIIRPDGRPLETYAEVAQRADQLQKELDGLRRQAQE